MTMTRTMTMTMETTAGQATMGRDEGIGLHGWVTVMWSTAGGIVVGGLLVALMTLGGQMSGHGLFMTSSGLFVIGALLGAAGRLLIVDARSGKKVRDLGHSDWQTAGFSPDGKLLAADSGGVLRVGGTRVTLESLVHCFHEGATAEEIALRFPTLELADVYSAVA